jgi:hypothetical protein
MMTVKKLTLVAALAGFICLSFSASQAARKVVGFDNQSRSRGLLKTVPGQLNYQGYLADAGDSSAVTATVEMTFRLFDSETKGVELWSETHTMVPVSEGLFQVLLGSQTAFPAGLFDGTLLWLQTEIGAEVLVPRKSLVSTAYSHRANSAEMLLDYTLTDLDDRWVNEDQLNSVTSAMINDLEIVDVDISGTAAIDPSKIAGTAWTGDNDGIGSGLDADLLDGQEAAAFMGTADLDHLDAADGDPANAVYVDNDGNVGIGTTSPTAPLTIQTIVGTEVQFVTDGSNVDVAAPVQFNLGTSGPFNLHLQTNTQNRLAITGAGDVGIGTTTPGYPLEVNGAVSATTYWGDGSNLTGISGTSDGDWTISGSDLYSAVAGNVGIGTTTPGAKLQVVDATGNYALLCNAVYGVYGRNISGDNYGYLGGSGIGVYGKDNDTGNYGYLGGGTYGVYGYSSAPKDDGELPTISSAVYGEAQGLGASGVYGIHTDSGNLGVLGHPDYAGYFDGDVEVTGDLAIGIGPSLYPLNVHGMANMLEFRMPTGAAAGHVLTSDASGVGTWQTAPAGLWSQLTPDYISANISPVCQIYADTGDWWGLLHAYDPQTAAATHWYNEGARVANCYDSPVTPDIFGLYALAGSDSNDIAVYGYGDEWGGYFGCEPGGVALYAEASDTSIVGMMGSSSGGVYGGYGLENYGILGYSTIYANYFRHKESPSDGDGQSTVYAYRMRDSRSDGSSYLASGVNSAIKAFNLWGDSYTFAVAGHSFNDYPRSGGIIGGDNGGTYWGSYGYKNSSSNTYGGYATSWSSGAGKGDAASGIGLGAWGDLFGADIHGRVYGTYTEGGDYGLYSHGMVVRDDLDVHLQPAGTGSNTVLYTNVSTDVTVQTSGYCRLSQGRCQVTFDENFRRVVSPEVPVVVTVTPIGGSNGVHLDRVDPSGFTVVENNAGKGDAQVAFIAIGRRAGYEDPQLPVEVVSADYVDKISRGLHNDADTSTDGQGLYYEDGRLIVGQHTSMLPNPDKSREPVEEAQPQLPRKPRRDERREVSQDNRIR